MEKNLGHATAYGYAKSKGYSGTEDEFAQLMADYASVGQSAAQSAEQAAASATSASGSAATASQAAQAATDKASEAVTAADTATTKASEASTSADTASTAAQTATDKASEATTAASTATTKASEAVVSANTATTAKTDAETARDAAAQSASDAAASAESIDPETLEHKAYGAYVVESASGAIASFADGADNIPMKDVLVHIEPVQEGSGDPSPENVRPITGWTGCVISHSGADMTNPTTYPITFPTEAGTVYGGTLDVTKGELVVDRAMKSFNGTEAEWSGTAMSNNTRRFYTTIRYGSSVVTACDSYIANKIWTEIGYIFINDRRMGITPAWGQDISDMNTFKSKLAEHPFTIIYSVTPITYQLTPQEITSLLGVNNVWADTGDTEVTYRADTTLYIKRLTDSDTDMISDSNIVSGQYFMIGTDLYKATVNIASGASVIVGTNATKVSLAQALNEINA